MGKIGPLEIILILVVVVLLFGGRKIPELMKGIGQGLKEYKKAKDTADADTDKSAGKEILIRKSILSLIECRFCFLKNFLEKIFNLSVADLPVFYLVRESSVTRTLSNVTGTPVRSWWSWTNICGTAVRKCLKDYVRPLLLGMPADTAFTI
jgi:sec-independent protein translocase protein TatA